MAQKLQSDLLGQRIHFILNDIPGTIGACLYGLCGTIRSVYIDKDGTPCYTVEVGGELHEVYARMFELLT